MHLFPVLTSQVHPLPSSRSIELQSCNATNHTLLSWLQLVVFSSGHVRFNLASLLSHLILSLEYHHFNFPYLLTHLNPLTSTQHTHMFFYIHILTLLFLSQSSPRSSSPPSPLPSAKSPFSPPPAAPSSSISILGPARAKMLPLWCKSTCSGTVRPRAGFQVFLSSLLFFSFHL